MTQQSKPEDVSDNKAVIAAMTLGDADATFDKMAVAEIAVTKIAARFELAIAKLKAKAAELIAPHQKICDEEWDKLSKFIISHAHLFQDPRSRKTSYGSYGLRAGKASVEISDEDKVIEFADRHQLDLYATSYVIDKNAVKGELAKGKVPGASLKPAADEVFGKVEKRLIDDAKKAAQK